MKLAVRSTGAHPWRRAHNLVTVALTVFAATALPAQVVFHVTFGRSLGDGGLRPAAGLRQAARPRR